MANEKTYRYAHWKFDDRDIDLLVEIVHLWADVSTAPLDRRHFNNNDVIRCANTGWLVKKGRNIKKTYRNGEIVRRRWVKDLDRWYPSCEHAPLHSVLPQEALWRLVKPILENKDGFGFSITKDPGWKRLGIYPNDEDALERIEAILLKLDGFNYIRFQARGSLWRIDLTLDRAIRSN